MDYESSESAGERVESVCLYLYLIEGFSLFHAVSKRDSYDTRPCPNTAT